jgi:hypothetical protein
MWLLVPIADNTSGDEWLGTIQQNGEEISEWTINLVRQWKYGDPDDKHLSVKHALYELCWT